KTFLYIYDTNSITIHIYTTVNAPIMFNGYAFQVTSYQSSASATYPSLTEAVTAAGTIITMPSGLIYSLQLETINSYSVQMQLEETNLSLIDPSNSSNLPIGIALVSLGLLGAAVFAAPSIFKRLKRKPATTPSTPGETDTDEKPPYWVD